MIRTDAEPLTRQSTPLVAENEVWMDWATPPSGVALARARKYEPSSAQAKSSLRVCTPPYWSVRTCFWAPSETTPGPLVIGTINAAPGHRVVPSGRHGIAVTLKVGKADEPRSQVKDFTRRLLAQLELKLNSQLNSIDAADIDLAALGSVDEVARAMLSQLPASHPFDEVIGPFYDVNGAANRLHVSPETMQARAGSNELLACPTAEGDLVFPTFQFNSDGTALPGLGGVLTALAAGTEDRWHVAMWLNTPNELLKGKTPRELLDRGESAVVQKVAEQTAERWCH